MTKVATKTASLPEQPRAGADASKKKRAILAAALELFAEQGFHGVSVPELAKRAGVGAGTIYRYFASKEALVNELYQLHKAQIGEMLLAEFPFDKTPREQFREFWTRAIAFARKHPNVVRFLELHHHTPYLDAASKQIQQSIERMAVSYFERSSQLGVTKNVPAPVLMALVWGAILGLMKAAWAGEVKLGDELIAASEQCLWEAIRA